MTLLRGRGGVARVATWLTAAEERVFHFHTASLRWWMLFCRPVGFRPPRSYDDVMKIDFGTQVRRGVGWWCELGDGLGGFVPLLWLFCLFQMLAFALVRNARSFCS